MRCHHIGLLSIALFAGFALTGCAQKAEQAASQSTSDSLVASNPTEQTSGDITPQTTYQEPPKAEAPAAEPKPKKERKPKPEEGASNPAPESSSPSAPPSEPPGAPSA